MRTQLATAAIDLLKREACSPLPAQPAVDPRCGSELRQGSRQIGEADMHDAILSACFKTRGFLRSCSPKPGAIAASLKWPFGASVFLALALAAKCATAHDEMPYAVLKAATGEVMSAAMLDGDAGHDRWTRVDGIVQSRILPLFDFPRMTQLALARHWRLASAEQQAILIGEFRSLLARSYSAALSDCRESVIEFKRLRVSDGDTAARIRSEATQQGKGNLNIDYDIELTPWGWKVFDIKVGGVSLIATYRESFAAVVRDEGIVGLIRSLSRRNRLADFADEPDQITFSDRYRILFAMLRSALQGHR
jgi:phospholipid transport system substrate-binding protein